jgi:hypothetical protein
MDDGLDSGGTFSKRKISKIKTTEMKLFRSTVGETRRYRIRNEISRAVVGIKNLLIEFDEKCLPCFGHIKGMMRKRL